MTDPSLMTVPVDDHAFHRGKSWKAQELENWGARKHSQIHLHFGQVTASLTLQTSTWTAQFTVSKHLGVNVYCVATD